VGWDLFPWGSAHPQGVAERCRCTAVGILSKAGTEPRGWYAPHRAIAFLGVLLILVAIAGGALGVVNSARSERLTALLANHYLILQPSVRELRASVADFQIAAERVFAGSTPDTTTVTAAVADSTASDRSYITLQRLLELPGNTDLAPHLTKQMAAYVAARSSLGAFLAGEAATPQLAHLASIERIADTNLDTALGSL
jgi:hypothetical protein